MRHSHLATIAVLALVATACRSEHPVTAATAPMQEGGSGSSWAVQQPVADPGAPLIGTSSAVEQHAASDGAFTTPLAVDWRRGFDGTYTFTTFAPASIVRVQYVLDGTLLGVAAADAAMHTALPAGEGHAITVIGFDDRGNVAAVSHGMIDVTEVPGVSIRPTGLHQYEVRLERAGDVNTIEVDVDGATLTDLESGARQSGRRAVRGTIDSEGRHEITVATFIESGVPRGMLQRAFVID
jgi:hypothetical protein